ncbi:hypothetical protein EON65_02080 [archaeon]|nr:MAG: hypothetical protein EON65_02080 [archaeon]
MRFYLLFRLVSYLAVAVFCLKSLVESYSDKNSFNFGSLYGFHDEHKNKSTGHLSRPLRKLHSTKISSLFMSAAGVLNKEGLSGLASGTLASLAPVNHNFRAYLSAVKISPTGTTTNINILKQQLANDLHLPLRDLRVIDPTFPNQIQAAFLARPRAILFTLESIKVVVLPDQAIVFNPFNPDVQQFITVLQQQLVQQSGEGDDPSLSFSPSPPVEGIAVGVEVGVGGADYIPASYASVPIPFEHIVMETALSLVSISLATKIRGLEPLVASTLNGLRAESRGLDVLQTQADELLPLKNQLDELRKKAREVKRALLEVLQSDEDMALMCLSVPSPSPSPLPTKQIGSSVGAAATMSLEMLFENYLNEIEWIAAEVDDILDEVRNTEENVDLQLDLLRNRILKFELKLSIITFLTSCGALVTGLFGMNLLNHFERSGVVFYAVTAMIIFGMFSGFRGFLRYAKRDKLL